MLETSLSVSPHENKLCACPRREEFIKDMYVYLLATLS